MKLLRSSSIEELFKKFYGNDDRIIAENIHRYEKNTEDYVKYFSSVPHYLFSSPSRTEICGNHTDHNGGRVLAASVSPDSIAAVAKNDDNTIRIYSEGYPTPFKVVLKDLYPVEKEKGTTTALIRGIAARFKELGFEIGGFNATVQSKVLIGSGLSSSASIEVLIGIILNHLFNRNEISKKDLALIGQYAENNYFNKPCGLMDQLTIAVGGIVSIDFKDAENPKVRTVDFDISTENYGLLVVDTGGSHADLTDDYSSIAREMKAVARELGGTVCRDISFQNLIDRLPQLRLKVGDRAILRAIHFLEDDHRVLEQVEALESKDFSTFLNLVNDSGNSSCRWLQNCYTTKNPSEQGLSLALALTENFIKRTGIDGACRVHGGGFAGTIQVFMRKDLIESYIDLIENSFTKGCVMKLHFRPVGARCLNSIPE